MQRFFLVLLVAAALATFAALAMQPSNAATASACVGDRWAVKTLQDRPNLLPARKTTIHFLINRPAPSHLPATRLPFEHHVFTVIAAVVLVRPEGDSDLHVVLQSGRDHMITEAPRRRTSRRSSGYCRSRLPSPGVASSTSIAARPGSRRTRSSCTRSCVSPASPVSPFRGLDSD